MVVVGGILSSETTKNDGTRLVDDRQHCQVPCVSTDGTPYHFEAAWSLWQDTAVVAY